MQWASLCLHWLYCVIKLCHKFEDNLYATKGGPD